MTARQPPSLSARLIALMAVVLLGGAGALGGLAAVAARTAADAAYDRLLAGAAFQIAGALQIADGVASVDPPVSAFETLALADDDRIAYVVVGPDGTVLTGDPLLAALVPEARALAPATANVTVRGAAMRALVIDRPLSDRRVSGLARIVVAQTTLSRERLAWDLTAKALVGVIALSALALASIAFAVRLALQPLGRVEALLRRRTPTELTPVDLPVPREIRPLVDALNAFTERLAAHIQATHRFIADAAHQLRTPVAALAGQVDMLGGESDHARREHQLDRIRERADDISRLTTQLLNHAMVIHRADTVAHDAIDLRDLVRTVLRTAIPLTEAREVEIGFDAGAEAVVVRGDAVSLGEALANLVHNALRHGVRSRLDLAVRAADGMGEVWVTDDGPGLEDAAFARMLRPFQSGAAGGFGLGLAIAAEVARAHGGGIAARRVPAGFAVGLRIPLVTP